MSTPPLLCVTIAAANTAELRQRRDAVQGADLIELRLDSVVDPDVAGALSGKRTPVIVTCRPGWEGGSFTGSEPERKAILAAALHQGAEYVDIEFKAGFDDLIASRQGRGIVISSHDFHGVPADLHERVREMRRTGAEVVKVAVFARSLEDNLALLPLREPASKSVLLAMGDAGVPSRVLAARFGSCWTYAGDAHAPGQVRLEKMVEIYRFKEITDTTPIYGVVGSPLTHSISPAMHNAAFRAARADAVYVPMTASSADDFLAFASALDVRGASITIPYKVDLFARTDEVDALSRTAGAINTLRRRGDSWEGRNTDISGFLAPLAGRVTPGMRAAVLGSGGAARGVATALASIGAQVAIYARSAAKAEDVAQRAGGTAALLPPPAGSWDLLVNTTPLGTVPKTEETPFSGGFDGRIVYDLVYNPMRTRLLKEAAAAGCDTIGGLDMLVAQAEDQSEWWLERRPPAGIMRRAALEALGLEQETVTR